jgi:hypothetical protein
MPSANWHCELGGILIKGVVRNEVNSMGRDPIRDPRVVRYWWYDNLRGLQGIVDNAVHSGPGYLYFTREGSTVTRCFVGTSCSLTAGNSFNHSFFSSISQGREDDQSTIRGEYQLVVPRDAVINEYTHDDASILDGHWLHADTLSPPEGDTEGQAIGVWLFQSGPNTLSVIARERSSQGGSDFLVGYEVVLGRTREERDERALVGPVRLGADTGPLDGITGSAPFLLTNFDKGNFHLLVPREDQASRESRIEHYTQEGSILGQWKHVATLHPPSDVPGTIITAVTFVQSSQKKFEAVARVTPPNQGDNYLVGYELDLGAVNHQQGWSPPFRLVTDTGPIGVTGSPIIIESDVGEKNRFHLLVPTKAVTVQYTLDVGSFGDGSKGRWKSFATLNPFQDLPVTAVSLVENLDGGFEAVTRVQLLQGDEMVVGYELQPGATKWSDGVALNADDGPIRAGKSTSSVDTPPTSSIG